MKKFFVFLPAFLFILTPGFSQSFEAGYELYQNEKYDSAAVIFSQLEEDRALLFAGKSHFASGNYPQAIHFLNIVKDTSAVAIQHEAWFTLALTQFKIKNYDVSLELLHRLLNSNNRTGLRVESQRLYGQILRFLSSNERFTVYSRLNNQSIKNDLLDISKNRMPQEEYRVLVKQHTSTLTDSLEIASYNESLYDISSVPFTFRYPNAPDGMIYNIGVLLPTFDEDETEFTVSRNLYFGLLLAAENFNSRNPDMKVFLNYKNSLSDSVNIEEAFTDLKWTHHADAVVGPLFSEAAEEAASLAEEFMIPMLTPLANSDSINLDYNYTFQLNPTFGVHGRNLARYAVNELNLDTLAIITETNALGTPSALGFRYEAEKLGAHIAYYFEEDFASTGYDLRPITEVFTPDSVLVDSLGYTPVQGIYAPFTGQAAPTLINLLLTDLEAMGTDVTLLGSAEWGAANLTDSQLETFEIYFTEPFGAEPDSIELSQFIEDFELRFGTEPNQFARIGYDTGNYLLNALQEAGNPEYLNQVIRRLPKFSGLEFQIEFNSKRINQHVNIRHRGIIKEEEVEEM